VYLDVLEGRERRMSILTREGKESSSCLRKVESERTGKDWNFATLEYSESL